MTLVKIICIEEHVHEVHGFVFGQWAANPGLSHESCIPNELQWTVTLVPSGRCIRSAIGRWLDPEDAIRLARTLGAEVPTIADWRRVPPDVASQIKTVSASFVATLRLGDTRR